MKFALKLGMIAALVLGPVGVSAQDIKYGNDASKWARDGECDDRRFQGAAMARGLDRDDIGHDATDCRRGVDRGELSLWDFGAAKARTQCDSIDFGDNSSDWPNDGQCDDYRFDGPGADHVRLEEDLKGEAADCRELCELGQIALRDY